MSGRSFQPKPDKPKRQFKPNLSVAGKKEVKQEVLSPPKPNVSRRGRGRGGPRPKVEREIVQSAGIFSEGPAAQAQTSSSFAASRGERAGSSGQSSRGGRGGSKLRRVKMEVDSDAPKKEFLDFDAESDDEDIEDMVDLKTFLSDIKPSTHVPMELGDIKTDAGDRTKTKLSTETVPTQQPAELIQRAVDNPQELMFIQLPNTLSDMLAENVRKAAEQERMRKIEQDELRVDDEPNTSKSQESDETEKRHCLDGFPSGKIGKIQVMKSGKVRLLIGNTVLDMEAGSNVKYRQEIATIKVGDQSGELNVLGPVGPRLVCTQDIESLVDSYKSGNQ